MTTPCRGVMTSNTWTMTSAPQRKSTGSGASGGKRAWSPRARCRSGKRAVASSSRYSRLIKRSSNDALRRPDQRSDTLHRHARACRVQDPIPCLVVQHDQSDCACRNTCAVEVFRHRRAVDTEPPSERVDRVALLVRLEELRDLRLRQPDLLLEAPFVSIPRRCLAPAGVPDERQRRVFATPEIRVVSQGFHEETGEGTPEGTSESCSDQ